MPLLLLLFDFSIQIQRGAKCFVVALKDVVIIRTVGLFDPGSDKKT